MQFALNNSFLYEQLTKDVKIIGVFKNNESHKPYKNTWSKHAPSSLN